MYGGGHWVVVTGYDGERVYLMDPAAGEHIVPKGEFLEIWHDVDAYGKQYRYYGIVIGRPAVQESLSALHEELTGPTTTAIEPLPPEAALEYFRRLVPTIGFPKQPTIALNTGHQVAFKPHPAASEQETMVYVDPQRLDQAWAKDTGYYLPPEAVGTSERPGARDGIKQFLGTQRSVEAPRVDLSGGVLSFTDGRHRFAVLRDLDAPSVAVMVPNDQLAQFKGLFGAQPAATADPLRFGQEQRRQAFTLARAFERDTLVKVQGVIRDAIATGKRVSEAPKDVAAILDAAGVGGPGNDAYSRMVVRTNLMDSYNTGSDQERQDPDVIDTFPVWKYVGIEDGRERHTDADGNHRAHFGKYYPAEISFVQVRDSIKVSPWNCRCTAIPVSRWDWARLRAAGARIADGYRDVPAMAA
jgi:hypothetical protein